MDDKLQSIARARAEARPGPRKALADFYSRAHGGTLRSVLVLGVRQDGTPDIAHDIAPEDLDRIIGMLERAKHGLLSE